MPFFSGLVGGFSEAQAQRDEAAAQRENSVLQLIATQHPDDDVRAAALATMMSPRKPGGGALGMFFNKAAQNPMMPALQGLIRGTKQVTTPGAPVQAEPAPSRLPEGASAALPAGSPTEPGGPPMSLEAIHNAMPQAPGRTVAGPPTTATVPRGGLMGGVERARALTAAEAQGKIEGMLRGVSAMDTGAGAEADPSLRYEIAAHTLGVPLTRTDDAQGDRHFFIGTREIATAKGVSKPVGPEAQIETQAQNLLASGEASTIEEARALARSRAAAATTAGQQTAGSRAVITGAQAAVAPEMAQARLQQVRQRIVNAQATLQGTQLSNELKTRVLNGQLTGVEALRFAGQFFANRPGATTDEVNEVVAALTAGNRPVGGGGGGTAPAAIPPPGAAAVPTGVAAGAPPAATKPTPRSAAKPAALPPGKPMYKPDAAEQSTLDTIAAAKPMMQRIRGLLAGQENKNTWGSTAHAAGQALQAEVGHNPSDPVYQELDPLIQHLKVFALGPYLHGIRNGAFVKSVSDNTPSILDTPARITAKLDNLEKNFADIEAAVGSAKPGAGGAAGTGGGPPQPTYAWDQNGVRHIQTDPKAALPAGWTTTPPR